VDGEVDIYGGVEDVGTSKGTKLMPPFLSFFGTNVSSFAYALPLSWHRDLDNLLAGMTEDESEGRKERLDYIYYIIYPCLARTGSYLSAANSVVLIYDRKSCLRDGSLSICHMT
jgi:hypothetical protein